MGLQIKPLHDVLDYLDPRIENKVKAFLGRIRAGQRTDFRTAIWDGKSREEVRDDVLSFAIKSGSSSFNDLELSASNKFGSFSVRQPFDEVKEKVELYYQPKPFHIDEEVLAKAIIELSKLVPFGSLRATDVVTAYESSPKGTNWGLPFFSSDKRDYPRYLDLARQLEFRNYPIGDYWPCVLGVRSQPNQIGKPAKWRALHMASHVIVMEELRIQRPLLNTLKRHPWFVAWNTPIDINRRATSILQNSHGRAKLSSDFSSYDARLPREIIQGVFSCIRNWFRSSDHQLIHWLEDCFLHVGILCPDGYYTGRDGGVASGLGMTNLVDTLAQILVDMIIAIICDTRIEDAMYLGDDGVKLFSDEVTPEMYAEVCDLMNLSVSVDKSLYSDEEIDFLQRRHSLWYEKDNMNVGYRSFVRTACGVISFEVFSDISGYVLSLRGIQQVEQCSDNPHFSEMVEWLYEGDDFLHRTAPIALLEKAGGVRDRKSVV